MTTLATLLKDIFDTVIENYPTKHIGNWIYIKIDEYRRVQISFHNTHTNATHNVYDSIKLVLLHKENGKLHSQVVKFTDIFTQTYDMTHPRKITKYIWCCDNDYTWYGKPTNDDIQTMQYTLQNYIEIWI